MNSKIYYPIEGSDKSDSESVDSDQVESRITILSKWKIRDLGI